MVHIEEPQKQEPIVVACSQPSFDALSQEGASLREFRDVFRHSVLDALGRAPDQDGLLEQLLMDMERMRLALDVSQPLVEAASTVLRDLHDETGLHPPDL